MDPVSSTSAELPAYSPFADNVDRNADASETEPLLDPETEIHQHLPECVADGHGNILSLDPRLTEDPEALFNFLKVQARNEPMATLRVTVTHEEERVEKEWVTENGQRRERERRVKIPVTDLHFCIPVVWGSEHNSTRPVIFYAALPQTPAHRLSMSRSLGLSVYPAPFVSARHQVTWSEYLPFSSHHRWMERKRESSGVPGWIQQLSPLDENVLPSFFRKLWMDSPAATRKLKVDNEEKIRIWCEEFVQSKPMYKEWKTEKFIVGLDLDSLEALFREELTRSVTEFKNLFPHHSSTSWTWQKWNNTVTIRNPSILGKFFSLSTTYKVLLWITLIYPLVLFTVWAFSLGVKVDTVRVGVLYRWWRFIEGSEDVNSTQEAFELLDAQRGKETRSDSPPPRYPSGPSSANADYYNTKSSSGLSQRSKIRRDEVVNPSRDGDFHKGWYVREGESEREIVDAFRWSIRDAVLNKKCDGGYIRRCP
ncbi:hypothetical protein BT69DRAFT_1287261 [Atractiella rhizophila]|nr:hypothetical protein BT69DRAFT_1287261 [Atractiella rhizophila]